MPISNFPQEARKFEIQAFARPKNLEELKKSHVPFSGSPIKHPYDSKKIVLVPDPYSTSTFYYEFKTKDISYMEELPSIANIDGEMVPMARIWVAKMSLGVRCIPFIIDDLKK